MWFFSQKLLYPYRLFTEARHEFEQETAAVIQAVIDSYKDHDINTDADESARSSMTTEETSLIERVLSLILFQISD
jgi:hypothetical protein